MLQVEYENATSQFRPWLTYVCCCCCLQEVLSSEKPRFSISGWYHKATPQQGSEHASLQQLQMKAGEDQIQQHTEFEGEQHCLKRAASYMQIQSCCVHVFKQESLLMRMPAALVVAALKQEHLLLLHMRIACSGNTIAGALSKARYPTGSPHFLAHLQHLIICCCSVCACTLRPKRLALCQRLISHSCFSVDHNN
jgi:hypothetical protein